MSHKDKTMYLNSIIKDIDDTPNDVILLIKALFTYGKYSPETLIFLYKKLYNQLSIHHEDLYNQQIYKIQSIHKEESNEANNIDQELENMLELI